VTQDARAWFDQFPLDGIRASEQWCARHWAPCPLLGANGIGAAVELMRAFVDEIAAPGSSPAALSAQMQAAGRLCCTLGDERMYEIWGRWPPSPSEVIVP
jgi:hypothetical protein